MPTDGITKARSLISRWVREAMQAKEDETEIRLPEIADAAVAHFLNDEKFLRGPIADLIRLAAYESAQDYAHRTRGLIPIGDAVIKREGVTERARKSPFFSWLEHVGDRHLRFLDMTREELLEAAQERRQRASTDLEVASLEEALAEKLEGGQRVSERFTVEEIEEIRASLARQETIKRDLMQKRKRGAA